MLLDETAQSEVIVDPRDAAESAGLVYVSDEEPGIRRKKAGKGFAYVRPGGGKVDDATTLKRIRKLAIPRQAPQAIQVSPGLPRDPREH